ncbi:hypothetical protein [Dryocola sp. BD586]|uniref:hypothetical protein n=1 Tax=Dryocola sp. BD586 TaxID=3133271 RepID=UPI003F4FBE7A
MYIDPETGHPWITGRYFIEQMLAPSGNNDLIAAPVKSLGKRTPDTAGSARKQNGITANLHKFSLSGYS